MGYFVLFTNTRMSVEDILRIYRQKDVVEKAFMHSKPSMEPLHARSFWDPKYLIALRSYTMPEEPKDFTIL